MSLPCGLWHRLSQLRLAAALFTTLVAPAVEARSEVLVIGNNRAPLGRFGVDSDLPELRFADDDAAAFYELAMLAADEGQLLTVMDRDTQALYPNLVRIARAPTTAEVTAAVAAIRQRVLRYNEQRVPTTVFVFFSGHGTLDASSGPALSLFDGGITRRFLYQKILDQLPAEAVHLLIDACHAEAVVRPRDLETQRVAVSASEQTTVLLNSTLARYPRVGAILAAASDSQAHEWDQVRQGVFTYELLSALRGGADVNRDGRIEYSEVYAFMSAANRAVENPRARLFLVARPPDIDRRAALVDFNAFRATTQTTRLLAIPPSASAWHVDDEAGRRLATVHGEQGFAVDLWLPAQRPIFIRTGDREARIPAGGATIPFSDLKFGPASVRARGSVDEAVRRGLFSSTFGRGYYSGFVDRNSDFIPVALPRDSISNRAQGSPMMHQISRSWLVGTGMSNTVAENIAFSAGLRLGTRSGHGSGFLGSIDVLYGDSGAVAEWRTGVSAGWAWSLDWGKSSPYFGASVGAGLIRQDPDGVASRMSPFGSIAPILGNRLQLGPHFSTWIELQISALIYRRDGGTAASLAPELWLGGAVGL